MTPWFAFNLFFLVVVLTLAKDDLSYVIEEESPVGKVIGNLLIDAGLRDLIPSSDGSGVELGIQLYEEKTAGLVRLEGTTGKLFVAGRIDRESICPHKSGAGGVDRFPAIASDGAGMDQDFERATESDCQVDFSAHVPPDHWINFAVIIQDINDHAPTFTNEEVTGGATTSSTHTLHISEGVRPGYQLPLIGAIDEDYGENAIQTYRLQGNDFDNTMFAVKFSPPYELNLVVLGKLDYENKTSYKGFLEACDGGRPSPKCSSQDLAILVTDVNDNIPVFKKDVYHVRISETTPITSVITRIIAVDADSGEFGRIRYRFGQTFDKNVESYFGINENTGEVWLKRSLDAKSVAHLRIPIVAEDGGSIPKTSTTELQVEIDDVNNNAPWIQVKPIITDPQSTQRPANGFVQLWIEENQVVGTQIAIIVAGDKDVGPNGEVSCELRGENSYFQTYHSNFAHDQRIYSLQSKIQFDLEALAVPPHFNLQIECSDNGTPRLTSRQSIRVDVIDVNEFPGQFAPGQTHFLVRLAEDSPPGTFVFQAIATDQDATPQMQYEILDDLQGLFRIDMESGMVYTMQELDRETTDEIHFALRVREKVFLHQSAVATKSDIANITLIIEDANDNAPILTGKKVFLCKENRPGYDDSIGKLEASDPDLGENGTVRFRLANMTPFRRNSIFSVDSYSGEIRAKETLDREMTSQYVLGIELSDMGKPFPRKTIEEIIVEVLDENDNRPTWKAPRAVRDTVRVQEIAGVVRMGAGYSERERTSCIAFLNISEKVPRLGGLVKMLANDLDSPANANLSFILNHLNYYYDDGFYFSSHQMLKLSQKPYVLDPHKFFNISQADWILSMVAEEDRPIQGSGLYELHVRVSDNGHPPLHSDGLLYIRDETNRGLIDRLLSLPNRGRLSVLVMVTVLLVCSLLLLLVVCLVKSRHRFHGGGADAKVLSGRNAVDVDGCTGGAVFLASQSLGTSVEMTADMAASMTQGNNDSNFEDAANYVSMIGTQYTVCPSISRLTTNSNSLDAAMDTTISTRVGTKSFEISKMCGEQDWQVINAFESSCRRPPNDYSWMASFRGKDGVPTASAYPIARGSGVNGINGPLPGNGVFEEDLYPGRGANVASMILPPPPVPFANNACSLPLTFQSSRGI